MTIIACSAPLIWKGLLFASPVLSLVEGIFGK